MVQTAQRLGPAIGPVIGGLLAPLAGLRRSFLVVAGIYLVAFLLVLVLYDESPRRGAPVADPERPVTFRSILSFEHFVLLMGVIFALQFVDRSFGPVLPLYVAEIGTPMDRVPLVAGLLFSVAAGAGAIGHNVCHRLLRAHSLRAALAWSGIAGAAAALAYGLAGHVGWLAVATPVFGLAVGVATTAAFSAAAGLLPAGAHATGFGLLTSASLTGLALSPIVSGLVGAFSLRAVFLLDAAVFAIVAAAVRRLMTGDRARH
jgi:MFS family permease